MIGVGGVWEKGEWGLGWECEGWFVVGCMGSMFDFVSFSFLLLYFSGSERKVWIILRVLGCSVMGGLSRQRDLFYSILAVQLACNLIHMPVLLRHSYSLDWSASKLIFGTRTARSSLISWHPNNLHK